MVGHVKDSEDLKTQLAQAGNKLVVIDFFATWCGPCKAIAPKVEELSQEMPDIVFLKVDVDECEDVAEEYEIESMPTFVFIKRGKRLTSFCGANYERLKSVIEQNK